MTISLRQAFEIALILRDRNKTQFALRADEAPNDISAVLSGRRNCPRIVGKVEDFVRQAFLDFQISLTWGRFDD